VQDSWHDSWRAKFQAFDAEWQQKFAQFPGRRPAGEEAEEFEKLWAKYQAARRKAFPLASPKRSERIDTREKLAELIEQLRVQAVMHNEVILLADVRVAPRDEAWVLARAKAAALVGDLDLPPLAGSDARALLDLEAWCAGELQGISAACGAAFLPAAQVRLVFGLGAKEFRCFLKRHDIPRQRPLAKSGKPHPRRLLVDVARATTAIFNDARLSRNPTRIGRIRACLQRAELDKQLEDAAMAYLTGKRPK
jgi:hypothetical protein